MPRYYFVLLHAFQYSLGDYLSYIHTPNILAFFCVSSSTFGVDKTKRFIILTAVNATKELLDRLIEMAGKAQFISFTYTDKKAHEKARHTLIFGVNYRKQIQDSLTALQILAPTLTEPLQQQACKELMESYQKSLDCIDKGEINPNYTAKDAYVTIAQGIKYCVSTGEIHVSGLSHAKQVIEPGNWPVVNSKPLTLAKKALEKDLPKARWRQFAVTAENLQSARLQGVELVLP